MRRTTVKPALYRPFEGMLGRHHRAADDFPCPKHRASRPVLDKSEIIRKYTCLIFLSRPGRKSLLRCLTKQTLGGSCASAAGNPEHATCSTERIAVPMVGPIIQYRGNGCVSEDEEVLR